MPESPGDEGQRAYRDSGVDLEAAEQAVEQISELARDASRSEVVDGVGGFAGLIDLGDGRLLAAATDGVGTKLEVARMAGKLGTIGIDLVAMSANDVLCTGAEPLLFLDYLAMGRLVADEVAAIVAGVAEGCRRAGCALLGGETAEHPGVMDEDRFDLAGFCVGIVSRDALLGPDRVQAGDVLLGLRSTGLHANGFSLVRKVLLLPGRSLDEPVPALAGESLGEELLIPTAIYSQPVLGLRRTGLAHSAAHITGGGLTGNLPRALPSGLGAEIDTSAWEPPAVVSLIASSAGLEMDELFSVLNMGIGMVVVIPPGAEDDAIAEVQGSDCTAVVIGRVTEGSGVNLR